MLHSTMSATHGVEPAMVSWQLMHLTHGATHWLGCTSGYCSRLLHRSKSALACSCCSPLDVRSHSAADQGQHHRSDIAPDQETHALPSCSYLMMQAWPRWMHRRRHRPWRTSDGVRCGSHHNLSLSFMKYPQLAFVKARNSTAWQAWQS